MTLLSICIPTFNRGEFLGSTLRSVVDQITEDVEVIISDNGSSDSTDTLVRSFQARYPFIRYEKSEQNLGADRNFLKVVELSRAKYCWLLSSDDWIVPGAIQKVLSCLRADPDLAGITINRTCYDVRMEQIIPSDPPSILRESVTLTNSDECIEKLCIYSLYWTKNNLMQRKSLIVNT